MAEPSSPPRRLGLEFASPDSCGLRFPAALRVHRDQAFAKEDWRQLTGVIAPGGAIASPIWRSEPEIPLPLAYDLGPDVPVLEFTDGSGLPRRVLVRDPQAIHRHPRLWAVRGGA